MTDETFRARPAWRSQWALLLLTIAILAAAAAILVLSGGEQVLLALAVAVLGLIAALFMAYHRYVWKFTIEGNRVTRHHGIVFRNQKSVRLRDLRAIEFDQTLLGRILDFGRLSFYSSATDAAEVIFHGITSPAQVRDYVHRLMDTTEASQD